jgi:hypothetical protein
MLDRYLVEWTTLTSITVRCEGSIRALDDFPHTLPPTPVWQVSLVCSELIETKLAVGSAVDALQDLLTSARDYPEGTLSRLSQSIPTSAASGVSRAHELRELAENISRQRDKRNQK